jgi:hypothetical protein
MSQKPEFNASEYVMSAITVTDVLSRIIRILQTKRPAVPGRSLSWIGIQAGIKMHHDLPGG